MHLLEREEIHPVLQSIAAEPFAQMGRKVVDMPSTMQGEWEFFFGASGIRVDCMDFESHVQLA